MSRGSLYKGSEKFTPWTVFVILLVGGIKGVDTGNLLYILAGALIIVVYILTNSPFFKLFRLDKLFSALFVSSVVLSLVVPFALSHFGWIDVIWLKVLIVVGAGICWFVVNRFYTEEYLLSIGVEIKGF